MNVRRPRLVHRGHRVITRGVSSLGAVAACAFWYMVSSVDKLEAILVAATLLSTLVLCVMLYTRIRARQRWQAAWESYAKADLSRKSFKSVEEERTFSWVGTN